MLQNLRVFQLLLSDLPERIGKALARGEIVEEPTGMRYEPIIAHWIQDAIRDAGYRSADEFANAIGLPRSTLSRLLNGKADARVSTLVRIAEALSIHIGDFFYIPNPWPESPAPQPLRRQGRPSKQEIKVQITIPAGADIPDWLQDVLERKAKPDPAPTAKPRKGRKDQVIDLVLPDEDFEEEEEIPAPRSRTKKTKGSTVKIIETDDSEAVMALFLRGTKSGKSSPASANSRLVEIIGEPPEESRPRSAKASARRKRS